MIISSSSLLRMRNVSDTGCRENQNTHCVLNECFPENREAYEIMYKIVVEPDRPQMTMLRDARALNAG
jgi:hypothetical protein